jgi:dipeptidyl aminopeptidase/acylaminoacyl peptidase
VRTFGIKAGLLACLALLLPGSALAAQPPPAASRLPAIETAAVSPDGARLAYIGGAADDRVIFIAPLDDGGQPLTIRPGAVNVKGLRWAGSRHLLVQIAVYISDSNLGAGAKTPYTYRRDLIVDVTTGQVAGQLLRDINWSRFALDTPVLAVVDGERPYAVVQGLDVSPDALQAGMLNYIPKKGDDIVPALWRVDVATGKGRPVERGARQTYGYETDLMGEARLRWDYDDLAHTVTLKGRRKGAVGWTLIDTAPVEAPNFHVLGYSDPEDAVYLRRFADGASRVVRRRLVDGAEADVGPAQPSAHAGLLWDPYRGGPVAIVTGEERPLYQWLDPELAAIHGRLSKAFAGKDVSLASWSRDRARFVILTDAPGSPPAWFLYDVKTRQASSIGEAYPELAGVPLGTSRWITYAAGDGLKIPAYLTLPAPRVDGASPPLVVLPHGGPAARDAYGFDWVAQFLASRGYAVLQPQFRGSFGFGDAFERAGYGQWAGRMQTDLVDGAAATAGYGVDSKRVCIMGLGYGGHAALAGAAFRPEAFRCAVSVNGLSDLTLAVGDSRRDYAQEAALLVYWRERVGDRNIDSAGLTAASPARRLGGQASPILLMQSELDTVVSVDQGRTMARAMAVSGQAGELILLPGDDHDLSRSRNRQRVLDETEAFLAKYLPVAP